MRSKHALLSALLLSAWLGTSLLRAHAQETYRIAIKDAVGDVERITESFDMDMTIKASAEGQEKAFDVSSHEQEKFREEVLEVDAGSHSNRVRRAYSVYSKSENGAEGAKTKTASLQGKTVRLERKAGKVLVTSENGAVSEEDKASLQDSMDNTYSKIFPEHPIALGEEWTPDNKALLKTFKGADKLTIQCKLIDIVTAQGHKSAHFHVSMNVSMTPQGSGLVMAMTLEGEGYQALDIQRPLSLSFEGPITASGQETKDGTTITYAGKGTARIKITTDWQKVAGKAVSPANL